jgi:hypothetical protein
VVVSASIWLVLSERSVVVTSMSAPGSNAPGV